MLLWFLLLQTPMLSTLSEMDFANSVLPGICTFSPRRGLGPRNILGFGLHDKYGLDLRSSTKIEQMVQVLFSERCSKKPIVQVDWETGVEA